MLKLIQISWRNLWRNRRRTLLTLSIIVAGSTGLLLMGGFLHGIEESYREQWIRGQTGHLQVQAKGYFAEGARAPLEYLLKDGPALQKILESHPEVELVTPRIKFSGMASRGPASVTVLAIGVDPSKEARMARDPHSGGGSSLKILAGSDLDPQDSFGVVLGRGLQSALGLKIGDSFNFITTREAGAIDGTEFRVRGTFETIVKDFDDQGLKMNLSAAQQLLGLTGEIHSLVVLLKDTERTMALRDEFHKSLSNNPQKIEVIDWEEHAGFYRQGRALLFKIFQTVLWIMAAVFFFSITNTVNVALLERQREFGTMLALGNGRGVLFFVIMMEALFLGVTGALLGSLMGVGIGQWLTSLGIALPPIPGSSNPYLLTIRIHGPLLQMIFCLGVGATLIAALPPAFRVSHVPIVRALGYS